MLMFVGLMLLAGFFIYHEYLKYHLQLPEGCDEFGYLNLAKKIDEGELFANHAKRPFFPDLISHLRREFPNENSYRWIIAPHAYHLYPGRGKIINQYPPGVGLMLSLLPTHLRQTWFPLLCFLIWGLSWVACWRLSGNRDWMLCGVMFLLISFLFYLFNPVRLEFKRINSVAPTYGLLLASGWMISRKPRLSIALLGATTIFRLPNIILIVPLWIAFLAQGDRSSGIPRRLILKSVQTGLCALAGGFGIYLIYVWVLLGNPLLPTYSSIDQRFATMNGVWSNFEYYFVQDPSWAYVHLLGVGLLTYVAVMRNLKAWWFYGAGLVLYNYGFYLIHHVRISYYPYGSAFMIVGLAMSLWLEVPISKKIRWLLVGTFPIIIMILLTHLKLSDRTESPSYAEQIAKYQKAFGEVDVIWAENRSGTVEYTTNRAGFRYKWGPENVRLEIIRFLLSRGYSQVIWTSDTGMPPHEEILNFLKRNKIPFHDWESPDLGHGVEISAN